MFRSRRDGSGRRRRKERLVVAQSTDSSQDDQGASRNSYMPPLVDIEGKKPSDNPSSQEPIGNGSNTSSQEEPSDMNPSSQDETFENWGSTPTSTRSPFSTSESYTTSNDVTDSDLEKVTSGETANVSLHQHPPPLRKEKEIDHSGSFVSGVFRTEDFSAWAEAEYLREKQKLAVLSIALSAGQLAVLMLQLALCGVAPLDVNPILGPYPDAFSDWGGKNAYLMVKELELWRLVTPAFLHVGILHLLANAAVQLETCAYFEREWGSIKWLLIYLISEIGAVTFSSVVEPDTVAVGSSAALMGLFGAKLAQVLALSSFDANDEEGDFFLNSSQTVGMICMFTLIALLSLLSYIELSGHAGGLLAGFFAGFLFLSGSVQSTCARCLFVFFGLAVLVSGFAVLFYFLFTEIEPDEELADTCQYFRTLFAEGYDCECLWD